MKIKINSRELLYDISNIAYVIAETGETDAHGLHRITDICQEGNLDRVSDVLTLAFSRILEELEPLLVKTSFRLPEKTNRLPCNFILNFKDSQRLNAFLSLKIRETVREIMIASVLADWLGFLYPQFSRPWEQKREEAFAQLSLTASSLVSNFSVTTRKISII